MRVSIEIEEGDRAKIRQVNIVGNTQFEEEEIIDGFELSTGNWMSFMRQNDRYSKEALEGDLEVRDQRELLVDRQERDRGGAAADGTDVEPRFLPGSCRGA